MNFILLRSIEHFFFHVEFMMQSYITCLGEQWGLLRDERQCSQAIEAEARSVLQELSRVSQFPELCALARILFYVTSVRIRVLMRTLESNLVL